MADPLVFPLDSIRTDGWFERIGEGIGSFQALCDIIGERFFAFSMITGARITALTVDRRNPDNTLVDFTVGGNDTEATEVDTQRLTLADFRRRLVSALVAEEPTGPLPERLTDTEALQRHIGVRYLLLAPIFGYSLLELTSDDPAQESRLRVLHDGLEESFGLGDFHLRLRALVRDELDKVTRGTQRGAIDLSRVAEAAEAAAEGNHIRVLELLGPWPAPLAIFLRTPEGQMLGADSRATIARGLGFLGSSCVALGEVAKGEEVLRLAVQYAGDSPAAAEIFIRLGEAMLGDDRAAEAIGPLRRAANLGAEGRRVWPVLAQAFAARERWLATVGAIVEAEAAGAEPDALSEPRQRAEEALGPALAEWRSIISGV